LTKCGHFTHAIARSRKAAIAAAFSSRPKPAASAEAGGRARLCRAVTFSQESSFGSTESRPAFPCRH